MSISEIRVKFDSKAKKTLRDINMNALKRGIQHNIGIKQSNNIEDILPDQNEIRSILDDNKVNFNFIENEIGNIAWNKPEVFACMLALYLSDEQLERSKTWQDVRDFYIFDESNYNYSNDEGEDEGGNSNCACGKSISHSWIAKNIEYNTKIIIGKDCALKHKLVTKEEHTRMCKKEKQHRDFFVCTHCKKRCGDRKAIHEKQLKTCQNCIVLKQREKKERQKIIKQKLEFENRKKFPKCQFIGCSKNLDPSKPFRTCWKHKGLTLPKSTLCDSCDNTINQYHKTRTCFKCQSNQDKIERICETPNCEQVFEVTPSQVSWKKICFECYQSNKLKQDIADESCINNQLSLIGNDDFDDAALALL